MASNIQGAGPSETTGTCKETVVFSIVPTTLTSYSVKQLSVVVAKKKGFFDKRKNIAEKLIRSISPKRKAAITKTSPSNKEEVKEAKNKRIESDSSDDQNTYTPWHINRSFDAGDEEASGEPSSMEGSTCGKEDESGEDAGKNKQDWHRNNPLDFQRNNDIPADRWVIDHTRTLDSEIKKEHVAFLLKSSKVEEAEKPREAEKGKEQEKVEDQSFLRKGHFSGIMSVLYHGRYLYVIGVMVIGVATTNVCRLLLDPVEGKDPIPRWEKIKNFPATRQYHASAAINENIVVVGGGFHEGVNATGRSAITINPSKPNDKWSRYPLAFMKEKRVKHCVLVFNEIVYVFGGVGEGKYKLKSCERGLKSLKGWTSFSSMRHGRSSFIALHHGRMFYVIGGCDNEKRGCITMESFNMDTNQWMELDGFRTSTRSLIGFILENKICVLGGNPRTFDLTSQQLFSPKRLSADFLPSPAKVWNLSPSEINLPTIDLDDSLTCIVAVKKNIKQSLHLFS